jgi:hypothetical protein
MAAGEIAIKVLQMFEQVVEALALGPIIGPVLQIAQSVIPVLPINVFNGLHPILQYCSRFNFIQAED